MLAFLNADWFLNGVYPFLCFVGFVLAVVRAYRWLDGQSARLVADRAGGVAVMTDPSRTPLHGFAVLACCFDGTHKGLVFYQNDYRDTQEFNALRRRSVIVKEWRVSKADVKALDAHDDLKSLCPSCARVAPVLSAAKATQAAEPAVAPARRVKRARRFPEQLTFACF